jgi:hypothetical protein
MCFDPEHEYFDEGVDVEKVFKYKGTSGFKIDDEL